MQNEAVFESVPVWIRLTSFSEKKFFEMVRDNSRIKLKDLYRKICRSQVFRILDMLELIQKRMDLIILERKADICSVSNLPIINLKFNMKTEIIELDNKQAFALISVFKG